MKEYTHLSESERRRIERQLVAGKGVREIARLLHRGVGTISEEISRNKVRGRYKARKAKHKAYVRRRQSKLQSLAVIQDPGVRTFVEQKLSIGWSAQLIAGRFKKVLGHSDGPSTKAVYKFLYSVHGRSLEQYMPSHVWKKKGGPKRKVRVHLDGRRMIDERPAKVEKRKEFGHFEMDFIESGRNGKGSLLVLVERKSRYPFLVYTEDRTTPHINTLVAQTLADAPVLSITTDNDISFQKHEELSALLGADVFFCHPYTSSEKGTVENRNRQVRKPLPKGTDFSQVTTARIMKVEHDLRHRPLSVLGFRTPFEVWTEEMEKWAQKNHAPVRGMMVERLKVKEKCSA